MSLRGVSIIICTYNGIERLSSTLDSILQLNQGIPRELILVDNASTEDIQGFCQTYFSDSVSAIDFKLVREKKPGLTHARIAGIRVASYECLLFCDDDNALFSDYLELGVKVFDENPDVGVIGGRGIARLDIDQPEWFLKYQHSYAVGAQRSQTGLIEDRPGHVYGAGSFFRREPMLEILEAGFYPSLTGRTATSLLSGDDLEWCWLLQLQGYKIYYNDSLRFFHDLSATRLHKSYYIKLKAGTSAGGALLYAYRTFFEKRNLTETEFKARYSREYFKNRLRYLKNRIFKNADTWEQELAMAILKSRKQSFHRYTDESARLYRNLKKLFAV